MLSSPAIQRAFPPSITVRSPPHILQFLRHFSTRASRAVVLPITLGTAPRCAISQELGSRKWHDFQSSRVFTHGNISYRELPRLYRRGSSVTCVWEAKSTTSLGFALAAVVVEDEGGEGEMSDRQQATGAATRLLQSRKGRSRVSPAFSASTSSVPESFALKDD